MRIDSHNASTPILMATNKIDADMKTRQTATKMGEQLKDVKQNSGMQHHKINFITRGIHAIHHAISALSTHIGHKKTNTEVKPVAEHLSDMESVLPQSTNIIQAGNTTDSASLQPLSPKKGIIPPPPPLPEQTHITSTSQKEAEAKSAPSFADAIAGANLKQASNRPDTSPTTVTSPNDMMAQLKAKLANMRVALTGDNMETEHSASKNKFAQEIAELRKEYNSEAAVQKRQAAEAVMEARVAAAQQAEDEEKAAALAASKAKEFVAKAPLGPNNIPLPPPMPTGLLSGTPAKNLNTKSATPPETSRSNKGQYGIDPEVAKKQSSLIDELSALFASRANARTSTTGQDGSARINEMTSQEN